MRRFVRSFVVSSVRPEIKSTEDERFSNKDEDEGVIDCLYYEDRFNVFNLT